MKQYKPPFTTARIEARPAQLGIVQREAVKHQFQYHVLHHLVSLGKEVEDMYYIYMAILEAYVQLSPGQRADMEPPDVLLLHAGLEEASQGRTMAELRQHLQLLEQQVASLTEAHRVDTDRIAAQKETIARLRQLFFEQAARGREGIEQTLAQVEELTMTQEERDLAVMVPDPDKRHDIIRRFGDSASADDAIHYVVGSMVTDPAIPLTAEEARSEKFLKKIQPFLHHDDGDSISNLKDFAQKYFGTPRKRKKKTPKTEE